MATASKGTSPSRSSSRGRSSSNGAARAKSQSRTASRSQAKRSPAKKAQNGNGAAKSATAPSRQPSPDHNGRETLTNVGISVASATLGVAGGVLLGRNALRQGRKVLGIPMPSKVDLGGVGQQIGEAAKQFGQLAGEVRSLREKAEQIGRALT